MRLLSHHPMLCLLLSILSMAAYAIGQGDVGSVLVAALLAVVSWFVTEGPRGRTLPRWAGGLLVLAVGGMLTLELLAAPSELPRILGRLTLWVLVIKLYERRTARDHAHLLSLSLLLLLVGGMTPDPPLILGVIVVVYAVMLLYAVLLHQLYAAHERIVATRRRSEGVMTLGSVQPTAGPGLARHFRRLTAAVGFVVFVLSLVFFLLLPRGVVPGLTVLGGRLGGSGAQTTGFAEEVRLLSGTRITSSRRSVFTLRVTDASGNVRRSTGMLLVRGGVLDTYRGGQWTDATSLERIMGVEPRQPFDIVGQRDMQGLLRQEFEFERPVRRIFSVGPPMRIEAERSRSLRLHPATGAVTVASSGPGLSSYVVYGSDASIIEHDDADDPPLPVVSGFADPRHPGAARVRELMKEILVEAGVGHEPPDPPALEPWLRRSGNVVQRWFDSDRFRYTLDLSDIVHRGEDPIVQFLFETRRGHCEFFASGFAALFQSIGVEARLVTGYAVRQWDSVRQVYLADESTAHAWVELRSGPRRWLVFDPTPPSALPMMPSVDPMFADRFGRFYSMVEGAWQQHFVAFDDETQSRLLGNLDARGSGVLSGFADSIRSRLSEINRAFRLGVAGYIWMSVVTMIMIAFAMVFLRFLVRFRALRMLIGPTRLSFGLLRRRMAEVDFYPRMLRLLEQAGAGKPFWRTPLLHAHRLSEGDPETGEIVRTLTNRFYAIRFAGRENLPDKEAETNAALERLRERLHEWKRHSK